MIKKFPKYIIVLILFIFTCYLIFQVLSNKDNKLKIIFLDVGQGDSVLVIAPNGNKVLYDAGPPNGMVSVGLNQFIKYFDSNVDIFITSHPDSDHIGGFNSVLNYNPNYYIDNHKINFTSDFSDLEKSLMKKNIKRLTAVSGEAIELGSGVNIKILSPDGSVSNLSNNNSSVSILISYGKNQILLTGDMEIDEENNLIRKYGFNLDSVILKAGHHGAKTSTGANLLKATSPKYVIVSADKNNKYGHPNQATIDRIKNEGAEILETSKLGSIVFDCDLLDCNKNKN